VQLPLDKGDMIFFSPALFHGAGSNQSQSDRIANLVQISSAFGRTMETVNTTRMVLQPSTPRSSLAWSKTP
jgi:ectoine hydroxylase-related dioxygenase (phytanoyl-CoA dioxygenase family)